MWRQRSRSFRPDLIVLDIMLPSRSGLDVLRDLGDRVPVILLTARTDETDRVLGLELGADDYVVKPFSPRELVARVRSVLRRSSSPAGPAVIAVRRPRHRHRARVRWWSPAPRSS